MFDSHVSIHQHENTKNDIKLGLSLTCNEDLGKYRIFIWDKMIIFSLKFSQCFQFYILAFNICFSEILFLYISFFLIFSPFCLRFFKYFLCNLFFVIFLTFTYLTFLLCYLPQVFGDVQIIDSALREVGPRYNVQLHSK